MFKKIIIKEVNNDKDTPLNKIKKKKVDISKYYPNSFDGVYEDYCGDCVSMDLNTHRCKFHGCLVNPLDDACPNFESIF